ncbi:hypothetical protein NI17_009440 [Thermobifida halotolerans]|uniref:Uncharacterized protein n=1 Tax=Thermobifida halotolerans TaxID=483545 RepID=A0A399FXP5_9ACTN|nr:hypothetical protein [Thermobifida halotolerans]UOE21321.1 hypothetical protein NI17_009440 [Thermobifida halotolerans]
MTDQVFGHGACLLAGCGYPRPYRRRAVYRGGYALTRPRQWTAVALVAVALPALMIVAWPLLPLLAGLPSGALPLGRVLWALSKSAGQARRAVRLAMCRLPGDPWGRH